MKNYAVSVSRIEFDFFLLEIIFSAWSLTYFLFAFLAIAVALSVCSSYHMDKFNLKYSNLAEEFIKDLDLKCYESSTVDYLKKSG
jgi:hypothetical protein